ncbi:TetR/AcrR family transcriptional regulator [Sinobacterium caligoides]|nr:TetR/AcrR family transcriptional regulator [Sinobacterium caligoides]
MTKIATVAKAAKKAPTKTAKAKTAKGAKAREKLKLAAMVVLEREGFHKMRISDVTKQAGVAAGLFYHYFSDLKSLTLEVLDDFLARFEDVATIEREVPKGDWYARMYAHHLLSVRSYAEHPGIMRCMQQMADEDEGFAGRWRASKREQLKWLAALMPKLFPEAGFSEHQALMVVYTLGGSGETILRDYYINEDDELVQQPLSVEEMAELLTVTFYRGLFLENPPAEKLVYTANLRAMVRS